VAAQWSLQDYQNVDTFLDLAQTTPVASNADVRNSRLAGITGSWNRSLAHAWNPTFHLSLGLAQEKNRRERPDLSRDIRGLRIAATAQPWPKWTVGAGLAWQDNRYGAEFAAGLETRKDRFGVLDLSAAYALDRNWSARAEYQHVDQRSNIGLYQYNRDVVTLKLRYDVN
jgi:outer membrane receptor for ferric coprogen and ferric-rhodotorulic acid